MKKLFTLLFSTITIFALVSCNNVDTSSTTSVVTPSSSIITPSSYSDTSAVKETSSIDDAEEFFDESSSSIPVEESSSIEVPSSSAEESSSEEELSSIIESSSNIEESVSEDPISESSIQVTYHVKFVNYNDELLYETDVNEGEKAIYVGSTPTKPDYEIYEYTFTGWDKNLTVINSDLTTKAQYDQKVKEEEQGWGSFYDFD